MATSNANKSVPPAEDTEPSPKGKNYDRVLVTPMMDNGPQEKPISQMCYNYRWRTQKSHQERKLPRLSP
eukprot:10268898-Ditylum_brightwellii.AAC.1